MIGGLGRADQPKPELPPFFRHGVDHAVAVIPVKQVGLVNDDDILQAGGWQMALLDSFEKYFLKPEFDE